MNRASSAGRTAANAWWNPSQSMASDPSASGRIGGTSAPGSGSGISDWTDSPLSGAKAAT
jgi:hypothetical protein